jgi:D-beta-D-heptose 7-phosphate kinase/D-beta-D-heptose 1-phosphate adenosyltransferase
VLVKGADYAPDQIVGADFVEQLGGRVVRVELEPDQSTTRLVERLRASP